MIEEKTISTAYLNMTAFVVTIVVIITIMVPYFLLYDEEARDIHGYYFLFAIVTGIVVHELIHGLCLAKYASKGFKSVKFGFKRKTLVPYCHCKEAISCNQYRVAILMPAILLGIIPASIGFIMQSYTTLSFGCVMIVAASGDLFVFWMLRKINSNVLVIDHPDKIGFSIQQAPSETNNTTIK